LSVSAGRTIRRLAPGLAALLDYDRTWLRFDLMAGVSVAAVAIPVAIAYSQLAGLPPVYGLYASILPLVAYAFFGTSRQLIMAPDAATCAIVAAVVIPLSGADPARQVPLAAALAILAGVVCILAGLARLGFLTNFLARPILTGYLNGIAISIIASQLGRLLGFPVKSAGLFRTLLDVFSRLEETHGVTLAIGAGAFVLLRLLKRLTPGLPVPLIAAGLGIAISRWFDLGGRGVALVGEIPAGLPRLAIPDIGLADLEPLLLGAAGIALISFNSAMVTARGFATKNRYELDANQEFIALGLSDIGAGLLQGFAVSGADSRTAVNDAMGGKTQLTGLVAAALLVVTLLFLTVPLAALPVAVLSAVLVSAAISLFDWPGLARLRRISPQEFRLSLLTLLGVISVGVLPGVLVAVAVALLQLLAKASRPHDAVLGRIPGTDEYHNVADRPEAETIPGVVIYRFDFALLFFNADYLRSRVRSVLQATAAPVHSLILDAGTVATVDTTGIACLEEMLAELARKDIALWVAEARGPVRSMLDRTGLTRQIGPERILPSLGAAVAAASSRRKTGAAP